MYPHAHHFVYSLVVPQPEATALRPVPPCAGRLGAAGLSPEGAGLPWGGPAGVRMSLFKELDWKPMALVPVLALAALPAIGSPATWLTLTVAGLAMGMIVFIIASGLTLVFGLMDVLNFGHGLFIALGAFVATSVMGGMGDWTGSDELWRNMVAVLPAMVVAMAVAAAVGLAFERFIVRPVYGQHLKQILITMGGMIIGEELIKVLELFKSAVESGELDGQLEAAGLKLREGFGK